MERRGRAEQDVVPRNREIRVIRAIRVRSEDPRNPRPLFTDPRRQVAAGD
jgi:hypothetical protein